MALIAIGNQKKATLLAEATIGYTTVTTESTGGSSYYTTTTGGPIYISINQFDDTLAHSTDGITWTQVNTLPTQGTYHGTAYGDGKWVAIRSGAEVGAVYSTDGINWTVAPAMPFTWVNWNNLVYGNGKFVAISTEGQVAYSTDGINWSASYTANLQQFTVLIAGNGMFVAAGLAGNNSYVTNYSTNGINWTAVAVPNSSSWRNGAYGNGTFVLVGDNGAHAYSTNGINWSATGSGMPQVGGSSRSWIVTYGDGKFVALCWGLNTAAHSTNGINWTTYQISASAYYNDITYGNGKFIASQGSNVGDSHFYSTDGINWNSLLLSNNTWIGLNYGDTTIEIQTEIGGQGESGTAEVLSPIAIYTNPILKTTKVIKVEVSNLNSPIITYDLAKLSAGQTLSENNSTIWDKSVSGNSTDTLNNIFDMVATDSITVLPSTVDTVKVLVYGVETELSRYVVPLTGGGIAYSRDGITWYTSATQGTYKKVVFGDGVLVAVGYKIVSGSVRGFIAYSTNGVNWIESEIASTEVQDIVYANGKFVLVGAFNEIFYSSDGILWTSQNTSNSYSSTDYLNNKFVAWNYSGTVAYSTDGVSWTESSVNVQGFPEYITYGNGYYAATWLGVEQYKIGYSTNLTSWTLINTNALGYIPGYIGKITFANNKFVVTGSSAIFYSTNAQNWNMYVPSGAYPTFKDIAYLNNKFFAVARAQLANATGQIATSVNGSDWVLGTVPAMIGSESEYYVSYQENRYILIPSSSSMPSAYSSDGINWTTNVTNLSFKPAPAYRVY